MGASYEKRKQAKRGKINGRFTALPHSVILSKEYRALNNAACRLLIDIAAQYKGDNNGSLVACSKYLKPLGWNSNDTITKALKELLNGGFLIMTRQGMRPPLSRPSWFALGWLGLDVVDGLDISPRHYQRSSFSPLEHLVLKKNNTPFNGSAIKKLVPLSGALQHSPTPITGMYRIESDHKPAPLIGDFIYLPSESAEVIASVSKAVH